MLIAVAILSVIFIVAEFVGGCLGEYLPLILLLSIQIWKESEISAGSIAIMTDAGHMLSDLLSFVISIVAIRLSSKSGACFLE